MNEAYHFTVFGIASWGMGRATNFLLTRPNIILLLCCLFYLLHTIIQPFHECTRAVSSLSPGPKSGNTEQEAAASTFAKMTYGDTTRFGFRFGYGRFYAEGQVERIDGSRLKVMFLPRLTSGANALLQKHHPRVFRGQLQHYGVDYDKNDLSGNGILPLKKVLQAGKARHLTLLLHTRGLR